jgi:hypothetical protein
MRPLYFILLLFGFLDSCSTAMRKQGPTHDDGLNKDVDENCYYNLKYDVSKRLSFYPFSVADSVVLVSFRHQLDNYPIKGDRIVADSLIQRKHLSNAAIEELTDILYNNFYIKHSNIGSVSQCFFPRNAVLFYGKRNRLKESILICFHCTRYESSSGKYKLFGDDCDQKMELIRGFFIRQGVAFGTDTEVDSYPGETFKDEGIVIPSLKQ